MARQESLQSAAISVPELAALLDSFAGTFPIPPVPQAGRLGGLTTAFRHDPLVTSLPGRQAAEERFAKLVDQAYPDLDPVERERRIEIARRLHFAKMTLRSVESRTARSSRSRGKTA